MKDELRNQMRQKRRALTGAELAGNSEKITLNLFKLKCIQTAKTVCSFLSAFKEPDTMPIIQKLLSCGQAVCVPVTDEENVTLSLSYIHNVSDLKKGAYGIWEPSSTEEANCGDIDVMLVPGLAFGRDGARLGFGKGYYDRLLANSRSIKIGLCHSFQLFNTIPSDAHDVPMDYIITEKEIIKVR